MKTLFIVLSAFLAARVFPADYVQTLEVEYPDAASARAASVEPAKLPGGAVAAFSSRWDDTTYAHSKMADVFKNAGMKATFMLTKADEKFCNTCARKILGCGFAVGSHTITHRLLPEILPNEAFRETLAQRIMLESALDVPVVAFALPGYAADHPFYADAPRLVGECIARSGYQVQAALWSDNDKKYSLPEGTLLSSHLFNINDRNPKEALFGKKVSSALAAQGRDGIPHMSLGVHSWQSGAGMAELERILKKHRRADFWYCTQNEYAAYARQLEGLKISPARASGNMARFELSRVSARHIGDDVALEVRLSGTPARVRLDGVEIFPSESGLYRLPHRADMLSPRRIAAVENSGNSPDFSESPEKFPEISGGLHADMEKGKISLVIKNSGSEPLENCGVVFRLPPYFSEGAKSFDFPKLEAGGVERIEFNLPAKGNFKEAEAGDFYFAAQFDFLRGGSAGRIYFASILKGGEAMLPRPRDAAVFAGPVDGRLVSDSAMAEISAPGAALKNFGGSPEQKWLPCRRDKGARPFQIAPFSGDPAWAKAASKNRYSPKFSRIVALDFKTRKKNFDVFADFKNVKSLWLNGKKLETPKTGSRLSASGNAGANRIAVEYAQSFWTTISTPLSVSESGDPFDSAEFSRPASAGGAAR